MFDLFPILCFSEETKRGYTHPSFFYKLDYTPHTHTYTEQYESSRDSRTELIHGIYRVRRIHLFHF